MADSAAERIVLDDAVLAKQVQTLASAASNLSSQLGSAQARLGTTSFGIMNSFLVSAMNGMAAHTAELVDTAGQLSERMEAGVAATRAEFEALEDGYAQAFSVFEEAGQ